MSEKFTTVQIGGRAVFSARDYLHPDVVTEHAKRHYRAELEKARRYLDALTSGNGVEVWQHRGLYRWTNKRKVAP